MTIIPRTKDDVLVYLVDMETNFSYTAQLAEDLKNTDGAEVLRSIAKQIKTETRKLLVELGEEIYA